MNPTLIPFIQGSATSVADNLWAMVLRGVDCSGYLTTRMWIKSQLSPAKTTTNNYETNIFFYHSDHLGSSSFISNALGYATQHLQYLPFGETFVDQHGAFDSRYKFSAKEKDEQTQYSYFGARYYDSDLSVWLSVDPMADKYPSTSPYMYCAGNPVMFVDPDGRSLDDYFDSKTGEYLGNDKNLGVKTDNVRTISRENWTKINSSDKSNSKKALALHLISDKLDYHKPLADNIIISICNYYYQRAGYSLNELEDKTTKVMGDYRYGVNDYGQKTKTQNGIANMDINNTGDLILSVNNSSVGSLAGLKNRWDFISLFHHERGSHGRDFLNGVPYNYDTAYYWEQRAYYYQIISNWTTFQKTSEGFKQLILNNAADIDIYPLIH